MEDPRFGRYDRHAGHYRRLTIMKKTVQTIALVLVVLIVFAAISAVIAYGVKTDWTFKDTVAQGDDKTGDQTDDETPAEGVLLSGETTVTAGNLYIKPGDSDGIALFAKVIPAAEFTKNGISDSAESAILINVNAIEASIYTFKASWTDSRGAWSADKALSSYAQFKAQTKSAVFASLQPFGARVTLTVTAANGNSATCTIDYIRKLENLTAELYGENGEHLLSLPFKGAPAAPYRIPDNYIETAECGVFNGFKTEHFYSAGSIIEEYVLETVTVGTNAEEYQPLPGDPGFVMYLEKLLYKPGEKFDIGCLNGWDASNDIWQGIDLFNPEHIARIAKERPSINFTFKITGAITKQTYTKTWSATVDFTAAINYANNKV